MKISFWDILTGILMFAGFGVVLVFANIFIDPYTILNPFPPPTLQPTLRVPTATPTQRVLPAIWTVTPTGTLQTTTLQPSTTALPSSTSFVLPTRTPTNTSTPLPSATNVKTNTPTRTNTPPGGKTFTPTPSRTPTGSAGSFAITSVQNVSASPSSWSSACPYSISLSADISYTGDGIMTYYWVRSSDNAHFNGSLDVDGTSPDHLTTTITGGTAGYANTSTYSLYVDNPNHQQFGGVSLPIACSALAFTSSATFNAAENNTAVATVTTNTGGTTFSITGGLDQTLFNITSGGILTFASTQNFESPSDNGGNGVYNVLVHAVNGSQTADQAIAVTLTDVNDLTPAFTSGTSFSVAENTTAITTVTASDGDTSPTLTFTKTGGTDAALFNITTGGVLTFTSGRNFETPTDGVPTNNVYEVTIQVSDGLHTATQAIAVTVTNAAPVISSNGGGPTAAINVPENSTAVTTVTASDGDASTTMTYSKSGGADAALFNLDSGTGVLTFASAPDAETPGDAGGNNIYDVTVQVSDGALTDTQDIAVTVTNVNDNPPVITSDGGGTTASFSVAENTTAVTSVTSTDADAGATKTYSISGTDAARFTIGSSSGVLEFSSAPNFENPTDSGTNNVYDVIVQVSDGTNTDTQAIDVTVTNVAPTISSNGGGAIASVSIPENSTAVTTVVASDGDASTTMTYSISGGADAGLFTIVPSTGVLTFSSAPDFEIPGDAGANNIYDVTVQVSDGALTDTQDIAVTVTDIVGF
jgi:hypothetical protein